MAPYFTLQSGDIPAKRWRIHPRANPWLSAAGVKVNKTMKPKVLVTREVFDEVLEYLSQYFEVTSNQPDVPFNSETLAIKLSDKQGAMVTLSDRIDTTLLGRCPNLKAVCNIAVGYNNIDLEACTKAKVMATNTPGVLDDTTGDFTWALILATARRVTEAETYLRNRPMEWLEIKAVSGHGCSSCNAGHLRSGSYWSGGGAARYRF